MRARFDNVKTYLEGSVRQAFAALLGLPAESSSTIEDLADLDRIDQAFTELAALRIATRTRVASGSIASLNFYA